MDSFYLPRFWIRVTHDLLLNNDRFRDLPDSTALAFLRIYSVVAKRGMHGVMERNPMELCWDLRCSTEAMVEHLRLLEAAGFLRVEDQSVAVVGWADEQPATSDAERMKRHRMNPPVTNTVTNGVTNTVTNTVRIDQTRPDQTKENGLASVGVSGERR